MESRTYGTDIVGITIWKNEFLRCIEFNTYLLDMHLYADTIGETKISIGILRKIYFKFAIEYKS